MKRIVFTGGGSAGHVVPNIALIEELKIYEGIEISYFGSSGLEKSLIEPLGLPYFQIECPKLIRGKSLETFFQNLKIPFALHTAIRQAKQALKNVSPNVVFSKGGYVALPVVLAANRLNIPCFTHESDLSAGLANRLISKKCKAVFTSFPETAKGFKNGVFTGAPIRREIFNRDKLAAKIKFSLPINKKVILALGGGSGSQILNKGLRNALPKLSDYSVIHLCGKNNVERITATDYRQFEYLSDIGEAYAAADVVVARSGAGTAFELMALKKPVVFIPLEGQTRGDQIENAKYFEKRGLCKVLRQNELEKLPEKIKEILQDTQLQRNLARSKFSVGNEKILSAIKAAL